MNERFIALFGASVLMSFWSFGAMAQVETVQLTNITPADALVPSILVAGDREFGGNGPDVRTKLELKVSADGSRIDAHIFFNAKETRPDWSETEETFVVPVYRLEDSTKRIVRIIDQTTSETAFRSEAAGPQFLWPARDWEQLIAWIERLVEIIEGGTGERITIPDGVPCTSTEDCGRKLREGVLAAAADNKVYIREPSNGGPVASFMIVGDTGGPDISDDKNPKDDTRIEAIAFKPLRVEFAPRGATPVTSGAAMGMIERNTDRRGSDYRNMSLGLAGPEVCRAACASDRPCQSWTFVPAGHWGANAHCWLKNGVPAPTRASALVSGVKLTSQAGLEVGIDRPGRDYRGFAMAVSDVRICERSCQGDRVCQAFTFVPSNVWGGQAHCWLKNEVPAARRDGRLISGIKAKLN